MITVDDREVTEHPDIPTMLPGCQVQRQETDYMFLTVSSEVCGVERSEVGNLIQKIVSGELERQVRLASEVCNLFYLLPEGVWDEEAGKVISYRKKLVYLPAHNRREYAYILSHRYDSYQYDSLASLLIRLEQMGVRLLPASPNFMCSIRIIRLLETKLTEPPEARTLFRKVQSVLLPTKLTKNPAVPRLIALCPRLSEKTAVMLINKYETILNIVNAPESDVLRVDGMGATLLRRLKDNIGVS